MKLPVCYSALLFLSFIVFACHQPAAHKATLLASVAKEDDNVYDSLTVSELDATADDQLEYKIINNIQSRMDQQYTNEQEVLKGLSLPRQYIYFLNKLEGEVNNGGLDQYFRDTHDRYTGQTLSALSAIRANAFAALVKKALTIHNDRSLNEAQKQPKLSQLDDQFYKLYEKEDLDKLRIRYMRSHLAELADR